MLEMFADKVAIIPIFDSDKTASGLLYVPEQAKERVDQGVVYAVGPKCKNVKPGDYVIFSGYTGTTLMVNEGTFIIMHEPFIVAALTGDDIDNTEVLGLYFKDLEGVYFRATVYQALAFIARAIEEAPWKRGMKSKNMLEHRPAPSIERSSTSEDESDD